MKYGGVPMRHTKLVSLTAIAASALLVVSACSSSKSAGPAASGSRAAPPKLAAATAVGKGEGALNIIVWAGYAEDGTNDKTVDWGAPLRAADELQGERQGGQHLRRDGHVDEDRSVRRRLGLRRCNAEVDLRRRRRTGQHVAGGELRHGLAVPQGSAMELRQRTDVRDPAWLGGQRADVEPQGGHHAADLVERGIRRELAIQGENHRL